MYRKFILPHLKQEVEMAHGRGVKFGYILTKGATPLLNMIIEAGVDVLDPVQVAADGMAPSGRSPASVTGKSSSCSVFITAMFGV
jgi:hypothetical protein